MLKKCLLSLSIIPFVLTGCFEDPTAPTGPGAVNFSAKISNFTTQSLSSLPNWTSGKAVVDKIQFEYDGAGTQIIKETAVESTIDLATGVATPPLPAVSLEPGLYKKAKFKIHFRQNVKNFEVNGTWNGNVIKIENDHNDEAYAKTEDFLVDAAKVYKVNIILKPNLWFNKTELNDSDFQNATKDANGAILLSKDLNSELYSKYVKNKFEDITSFEQVAQ